MFLLAWEDWTDYYALVVSCGAIILYLCEEKVLPVHDFLFFFQELSMSFLLAFIGKLRSFLITTYIYIRLLFIFYCVFYYFYVFYVDNL